MLPDFLHSRRSYPVAVIGRTLELAASGMGPWLSSIRLQIPFSTVRDWRARCRRRAPVLVAQLAERGRQLGAVIDELPVRWLAAMVALLKAVWRRSRQRAPATTAARWRLWNAVCGGWALGRNRSPV